MSMQVISASKSLLCATITSEQRVLLGNIVMFCETFIEMRDMVEQIYFHKQDTFSNRGKQKCTVNSLSSPPGGGL